MTDEPRTEKVVHAVARGLSAALWALGDRVGYYEIRVDYADDTFQSIGGGIRLQDWRDD